MKALKPKILAGVFTLVIISILLAAGPAQAFILDMSISNDKPSEGETITFNVSTEVETADDPSDVGSFTLFIVSKDAKDIISCTFFPDGTKITACPGINVVQTSSPTFGYGYGYGFGTFSYEITLNTTGMNHGVYRTSFVANVDGKELKKEGKKLVINERKKKEDKEKVKICHIVIKGNKSKAETIKVKESAVAEHLEHGDHLGACTEEDSNNGEDDHDKEKVKICHVPDGNKSNAHTIEIAKSALKAHLDHGDMKGPCPNRDKDNDDEDDKKNKGKKGKDN